MQFGNVAGSLRFHLDWPGTMEVGIWQMGSRDERWWYGQLQFHFHTMYWFRTQPLRCGVVREVRR